MAGIALLLPNEVLCCQAEELLKNSTHHVVCTVQTSIDTVVAEARKAIANGANIVVSRGSQASAVKMHTNVPVVEIQLTAQELGLSIVKAKKIINKKHPTIGVFFWKGMLCDTTYFEELFNIRLLRYDLDNKADWFEMVEDAISKGMDFLISGERCVSYANQIGIPAVLFQTTEEALEVALKNAEKLYFASMIEQQNYAQFVSVLDSAFHGIIKTGDDGSILLMNRMMEQILDVTSEKVLGVPVTEVLKGLDEGIFRQVLDGARENYSTFIQTDLQALVIVVEPIQVEGMIIGTIISCNKMKRFNWDKGKNMRERFLGGFAAKGSLDELAERMPSLKGVIELAKLYAPSSSPILIEGKTAQELEDLCQGIHNYSLRKNGPFLVVNAAGIREEDQLKVLFGDGGESGLMGQANYGTMVIRGIDKLTLNAQYHLLSIIRKKRRISSVIDNENVQEMDVRIIGCTSKCLLELKEKGKIRKDLYYVLRTFRLAVPDFSQRKEDVKRLIDEHIKRYMNLYSRYYILTDEARQAAADYYWDGNDLQLEAFCERLVLTAGRRKITREMVNYQLDELYGRENVSDALREFGKDRLDDEGQRRTKGGLVNEELERLKTALEKYGGNRVLTAKALNISTSTLWRRMKKYNLK